MIHQRGEESLELLWKFICKFRLALHSYDKAVVGAFQGFYQPVRHSVGGSHEYGCALRLHEPLVVEAVHPYLPSGAHH